MPVATDDIYEGTLGDPIYAGIAAPDVFDSVVIASEDAGVPFTTPDQTFVLNLHGSSGANFSSGRQFRAAVSGFMAYETEDEFAFSTIRGTASLGKNVTLLRPIDLYGTRESHWIGFTGMGTPDLKFITERRLDALLEWAKINVPNLNPVRRAMIGGSMGGWGTITFGLRRPTEFAALYPDRPRWRYSSGTSVNIPDWNGPSVTYAAGSDPDIAVEDGGGSSAAHRDGIAYVSNTANKIPWVGWCMGRNDGFAPFEDQVAAVVALRAAKRGFCFVWNNGNHSEGSVINLVLDSYPFGTFELGKGYPLFTNHSGDQDPAVDLVGGINQGLSFRNVVESTSGWSCEVTSIAGARTVDVEPISEVFTATVTAQTVSIPAANTWVAVSFTA